MIHKDFFLRSLFCSLVLTLSSPLLAKSSDNDIKDLYRNNCAECHNENRFGAMGPALLPENLKRLRKKAAIEVIKNGRVATQMPAFGEKLSDKEIQSLVDYVYTPLAETPVWSMDQIKASQIIHNRESELSDKPVFEVEDLLNMFLVVELGDHHVTLLDG
ncbi:MAG: cytochrome c, partial [Gammaproteobacteria bacterium]|nr:cytochrome c [Gammaproteobacteria bacterium]